ncbi:MAG: HAD family hydrolase, partial [Pseudonocardia sp.]|nr:HAD family hydrolase [Pseudonocardia sp.]
MAAPATPATELSPPADREWDRLVAAIGFGLPVLVLAAVPAAQFPYWQWTAFALATPVVTWAAWPLYRAAAGALGRGSVDADTLTALAAAVAYGWSVWALTVGGAGAATHIHPLVLLAPRAPGSAQIYFEVTVVVVAAALAIRRLHVPLPDPAADDPAFPPRRTAASVARWYGPVALCLAGACAGFWAGADIPGRAVLGALAVLAIAAPLAVVLAVPVALATGLRRAADEGVLIESSAAAAAAGSVDTVVLGRALLCGPPAVIAVTRTAGTEEPDALAVAAALAAHSPDASASALTACAAFTPSIGGITVADGIVRGTTGARDVALGRPAALGLPVPAALGTPDVVVAWDGQVRAGFTIATPGRHPDAAAAVTALRDLGLTPVLLTSAGDDEARELAAGLPVGLVLPGAAPDRKADVIRRLQADGHGVVMVAEPLRDAAGLAAADLAVGVGAAAPIGIPAGEPLAAARSLELARRILATCEGGLAVAAGVPLVGLPAAAAGLVHPLLAAAVGPLLTLLVV